MSEAIHSFEFDNMEFELLLIFSTLAHFCWIRDVIPHRKKFMIVRHI